MKRISWCACVPMSPVEPPTPVASTAVGTPPAADPVPPPEALPPADPSGSELDLFRLDAALNAAVVTASGGAEEERSTALANVVIVSRTDILSRGYRSVAEILADVPGLYVIDDFVMPSLAVRGINGGLAAGTRIVKVMINGQVVGFRPELSAFLGPELLPLDAIERVEIAKGPLSSLYGANAFLATVNVITRRGDPGGTQGLVGELNGRLNVINGNAGGGGSMMLSYRGEHGWLLGSVAGERNDRSGILLPRSFAGQTLDRALFSKETHADLAAPISAFVNAGWSSERLGTLAAQLGLQRLDSVSSFRLNSLLTDASRVVINNLYASLRYDKVGTGKTGVGPHAQNLRDVGSAVYTAGAKAAVKFLSTQSGTDTSRISVYGLGEGTVHALALATDTGSGAPQIHSLALLQPLAGRYLDVITNRVRLSVDADVKAGAKTREQADQVMTDWTAAVASTRATGTPPTKLPEGLSAILNPGNAKAVLEADAIDPLALAAKVPNGTPVLLTCSDSDVQAYCEAEQPLITALAHTALTVVPLKGVSHVLRDDPSDNVANYANKAPLSPQLVTALDGFVGR